MDERIESFLADVLALEGEDENAIRNGVRVALTDYEQIFRAQEVNKRMKDKAAHACHALCRARVVEEIRRREGTATADHLKLVRTSSRGRVSHNRMDSDKWDSMALLLPWSVERAGERATGRSTVI